MKRLDNGVTLGAWGQIREWREDSQKLDTLGNPHRHLSQLIALYPGNQISYHKDATYADAAKRTLESRGDLGTGWSRAWKIAAWARLQDGEHAYRLLKSALDFSTLTVISMDSDQEEFMKIFLIRIRLSKLTVISELRQALPKCCYRVIRDLSICCLLYLLFGRMAV